jgi:hypothetical protein
MTATIINHKNSEVSSGSHPTESEYKGNGHHEITWGTDVPGATRPMKFGVYGQVAFSGTVWDNKCAKVMADSKYDWFWLQCSYPYSGDMSACATLLKAANKRIILHGYFCDDTAIVGAGYTNWDNFYAGGAPAIAMAVSAITAQINNIGFSRIDYVTINEEDPMTWTGTIAHYISCWNSIASGLRANFSGIKIMGSPDGTLSEAQVESLDMDALMYYNYVDVDDGGGTTYVNYMTNACTIATAKGWALDKIFTIICAQSSNSEVWAPDTHIENIDRAFKISAGLGITNIGFYALNEADASYECFLWNAYEPNIKSGVATAYTDNADIYHGYGGLLTPAMAFVTPTVANEIASVTTINSWLIKVALKKRSDGSAGTSQTVYWEVRDTEWHSPYLHKKAVEQLVATFA